MKVGIHGQNAVLNPNLEDCREGLPASARMKKNSMKMGLPNGEMKRKRDGDDHGEETSSSYGLEFHFGDGRMGETSNSRMELFLDSKESHNSEEKTRNDGRELPKCHYGHK